MGRMGRHRMEQIKLTVEDWDIVHKIKAYIKKAETTITMGLIWVEVGKIELKEMEQFDSKKVYIFNTEIIDCDVDNGTKQDRTYKIGKYIFIKEKARSLEGYKYEIEMKSKKRKRKIWD